MPSHLDELLEHIADLERQVESELNRARDTWRYGVRAGRIRFEHDVRLAHARLRQNIPRFLRDSSLRNALTAPVIYAMVVPISALDLSFTVYQHICFRAYGIARVRRSTYIVIDRHRLAYLNGIEKLNCVYCGYANGVFAYVREIAARTEQYWCPIRHATRVRAPHARYRYFVEYGDGEGYKTQLPILRERLAPQAPGDADERDESR